MHSGGVNGNFWRAADVTRRPCVFVCSRERDMAKYSVQFPPASYSFLAPLLYQVFPINSAQ